MKITNRMKRLPVISTARLVLRDIELSDITEDYLAWLNDPETTKYLEIRFTPQTMEDVREYVTSKLRDTVNTKHFGVYDSGGNRLVGTVTLPVINMHHRYADISFVIGHPEATGRGYATEAVHAVVYYAFRVCGLSKLWAGYYDGHAASARVLEKNGFTIEGRMKKKLINHDGERVDHILVGLLAADFKPDKGLLGEVNDE